LVDKSMVQLIDENLPHYRLLEGSAAPTGDI